MGRVTSARRTRRQALPRVVVAGAAPKLVDALNAARMDIETLTSAYGLVPISAKVCGATSE
jgi:hypothetical protein